MARYGPRTTGLRACTGSISPRDQSKRSSRSRHAPKGEPHNIYDVIPDSQNNAFFTDFRQRHIGRIDAKTGEVKLFATPTPRFGAAPRNDGCAGPVVVRRISRQPDRHVRYQDRGVSPSGSRRRRGQRPYDVTLDKNGEAWTGSMSTDRVAAPRYRRAARSSNICCRARPTFAACSSTTRPTR